MHFVCTLGKKKALHANHAKILQTRLNFQFELAEWKSVEQDPVSTMHKTDWTNYLPSLVWFGKKTFAYSLDGFNNHILVYKAILAWCQTNKQPPRWTKSKRACFWQVRRQSFAISSESNCSTFAPRIAWAKWWSFLWECHKSHQVNRQVKCFAIIWWWWDFLVTDWLRKSYLTKATK